MNPGELDKKISFMEQIDKGNKDVVGDTILESNIFKTVWAKIDYIKGKDYIEAKKFQSELICRITIRYLKGLTPDMQIKYGERFFNIQDIIDPLEKHEKLEIMCIEKVSKNG